MLQLFLQGRICSCRADPLLSRPPAPKPFLSFMAQGCPALGTQYLCCIYSDAIFFFSSPDSSLFYLPTCLQKYGASCRVSQGLGWKMAMAQTGIPPARGFRPPPALLLAGKMRFVAFTSAVPLPGCAPNECKGALGSSLVLQENLRSSAFERVSTLFLKQ